MNKRDAYPSMKEKASLLQKMVVFKSWVHYATKVLSRKVTYYLSSSRTARRLGMLILDDMDTCDPILTSFLLVLVSEVLTEVICVPETAVRCSLTTPTGISMYRFRCSETRSPCTCLSRSNPCSLEDDLEDPCMNLPTSLPNAIIAGLCPQAIIPFFGRWA